MNTIFEHQTSLELLGAVRVYSYLVINANVNIHINVKIYNYGHHVSRQ
jgi:hypothetical protein